MGRPQEIEFAWLLIFGIGIMAVLALAIILFVVFYQRKIFAHQLTLHRLDNEHRKHLLATSVEVQENERRRIAGDLHDEVGAVLSASKLYLTYFADNPEAISVAHKIEELIELAAQNLRDISHNIAPQNLEKFGLSSALEDLFKRVNGAKTLQVSLQADLEARLQLNQELGLYRIIQELLNNTIKHAQATQVKIVLQQKKSQVFFSYQDNGQGIDINSQSLDQSKGLGLRNLASRAELLNAQLNYHSAPSQGFQASLSFEI